MGVTIYLVYSRSQKKLNSYLEFLEIKVSKNISEITSNTSSLEYLLLVNERFLLDEVNLFMELKNKFNEKNKNLAILNIEEKENAEVTQFFQMLKVDSIPAIYKYDIDQNIFRKSIDFFEIENCRNDKEVSHFIMEAIIGDKRS